METTKAPCPLCGKLIKIWGTDWKCPACGTLNKNWNLMANCEWCRFGPHFLNCPHCKEDFDLSLIMGSYVDASGRPILDSGRRKVRPAIHRHRLGDLKSSVMGEPEQNVAKFFTDDFLALLANCEFYFPYIVRCFVAHTLFVSPDDRLWMHSWVFENAPPNEQEQPLGQFTLVYPSSSKDSERDYKKIDCVVNENFW